MKNKCKNILEIDYHSEPFTVLDLSSENTELNGVDLSDTSSFQQYIEKKMNEDGTNFAIGKYAEDRVIYNHSAIFESEERRTVHLGIDFWVKDGMKVYSPLDGKVHSFKDNTGIGNYGNTIILEHNTNNSKFYTLYGHLSKRSLWNLIEEKKIKAGDFICEVGNENENGNWPPHLHFQIINSIGDYKGDFPGVCKTSEKLKYFEICPDPNNLLKINNL